MLKVTRPFLLLILPLLLAACGRGDDTRVTELSQRIDDQAQQLVEIHDQLEEVRLGFDFMPDLGEEDLPRLERDLEARREHLQAAKATAAEIQGQVRRFHANNPISATEAERARLVEMKTRQVGMEAQIGQTRVRIERLGERAEQRHWDPTPEELLAADNTDQVISIDLALRELLFGVEQALVTADEAGPQIRYLMDQRENEVERQGKLIVQSWLSEAKNTAQDLDKQIVEVRSQIRLQELLVQELETRRVDLEFLMNEYAHAVQAIENAEREVARTELLITRAKLAVR